MQKMTSITHCISEIIHLNVEILTIFKVLANPTIGPVHLELFRPTVIRGPWIKIHQHQVAV
jgi:hypothetical protein